MEDELRNEAAGLIRDMRRLRLALTHGLNRRLAEAGITAAQFAAMGLLEQMGEATMTALAERLGTTMGAATSLVDKLVGAGHVSRTRSREDRRVVHVALTPPGRALLERYHTWGAESLVNFLGDVPPAERRSFLDILGRLAEFIEQDVTGPSPREEHP